MWKCTRNSLIFDIVDAVHLVKKYIRKLRRSSGRFRAVKNSSSCVCESRVGEVIVDVPLNFATHIIIYVYHLGQCVHYKLYRNWTPSAGWFFKFIWCDRKQRYVMRLWQWKKKIKTRKLISELEWSYAPHTYTHDIDHKQHINKLKWVSYRFTFLLLFFFYFVFCCSVCWFVVTYVDLENIFEFHLRYFCIDNSLHIDGDTLYSATRTHGSHTPCLPFSHTHAHTHRNGRQKCAAAGCRMHSSVSTGSSCVQNRNEKFRCRFGTKKKS